MAYFAVIKISDAQGNVVELHDVSELLTEIRDELKKVNLHLAAITDENIEKGDTE